MNHEIWMHRCLTLARLGEGAVRPNPLVGAVLVYEGRIISEGYHHSYGGRHAEIDCLSRVPPLYDTPNVYRKSTLYVNLEPCCHYGKTPPCTDTILHFGIPKVVIGSVDTNPMVAERGVQKLLESGVEVLSPILEAECRALNKRFFTYHEKKRPYVCLKWACSQDGFLAADARQPLRISNQCTDFWMHRSRATEAAIMVGTHTALYDNPRLDVRLAQGSNPLRVCIDRHLRLPTSHHLLSNTQPTLICNEHKSERVGQTEWLQMSFSENLLPNILKALYERNVSSVVVEGGATLLQHFIDQGLWDEAVVITNPLLRLFSGLRVPVLKDHRRLREYKIVGDMLTHWRREER